MRAITVREPEWLDDDRDWALAQWQEEKNRCPGCRLPLDETVGEHNDGAFEAPPPQQCHACEALNDRKKEWQESGWDASDKLFWVRRKDQRISHSSGSASSAM